MGRSQSLKLESDKKGRFMSKDDNFVMTPWKWVQLLGILASFPIGFALFYVLILFPLASMIMGPAAFAMLPWNW